MTSKFWERDETAARSTQQVPDKPRVGRKSATSKVVPSVLPRMSNPTINPADAAAAPTLQPESKGEAAAAAASTASEAKRKLPSRRARSQYATGMRAGGSLLANLGEPRDDEALAEWAQPLEFIDDEADEDYEAGEEDMDEVSVQGSDEDDGAGLETRRSRRLRRRRARGQEEAEE